MGILIRVGGGGRGVETHFGGVVPPLLAISFHKYCPVQIERLLVPNVYLNLKCKVVLFAKMSHISGCHNSVNLTIIFNLEGSFTDMKSCKSSVL